jgi:hypothetical protein
MLTKDGITLTLKTVLYIPGFAKNIVSVTELTDKGTVVTMEAYHAELLQGDWMIVVEKEKGSKGMFYLQGKRIVGESEVLAVSLNK